MDDAADIAKRLLDGDTALWPQPNVADTRLGWLTIAERLAAEASELRAWADSVERSRVVLLGMGGSSLGPEVFRAAMFSNHLTVLDTTEPSTVAQATDDLSNALILVSSKSGGTLEVQTLLARCWEAQPDPSRYVAITDPGTGLDQLATERGFGKTFRNDANIGGRYSVLSYFGLVPAALLGYDVGALLDAAAGVDAVDAVEHGLAMGSAAAEGRDKATIRVPEAYAEFGLWVEQLIAESLGKHGKGVVPVPTTEPEHGEDRHEMTVSLSSPEDLGRAFMWWELATAAAGHAISVDPFDEPNVAESKANTKRVLDELPLPLVDTVAPDAVGDWLQQQVRTGDYVSLQAYMPYGDSFGLDQARHRVRDALAGMAVTAGYGPRFLHSTGQLHKGGPNSVVVVQIVPRSARAALAIPGFGYDFATLIDAQAIGDHQSLVQHGRRVLRVAVDDFAEIY
ncbi:MAG: transaldolase / glucose-6-phosphate isomerase [Actinomycetota bacterium]|jgi:glucose-6-phosphate isomerase/transaldolase/glucose-6-phosphate isomerase